MIIISVVVLHDETVHIINDELFFVFFRKSVRNNNIDAKYVHGTISCKAHRHFFCLVGNMYGP